MTANDVRVDVLSVLTDLRQIRSGEWMVAANCHGIDTAAFFPVASTGSVVDAAVAVCRRCPVARICAAWALEMGQSDGVHAGLRLAGRESRKDDRRVLRKVVETGLLPASPRASDVAARRASTTRCTDTMTGMCVDGAA